MQDHRRVGWYTLGGALSALGGAWLVAYLVACLQSSAPHKLHYWVPVTFAAIALVVVGIVIIFAVMYDWLDPLVEGIPGLHRKALSVRIVDVRWDNYKYIALIGGFRVRVKNTTGTRVMISGVSSTNDRGLPNWRGTASAAQVNEVDTEIFQRLEGHQYGPPLRMHSEVPAHETVSGWFVVAATRDPSGGTPAVSIVVTDDLGNQYEAHVKRTEPREATITVWQQPRSRRGG